MPEGDTIFRTARALGRALAGKPITGFRSTYPLLTRFNDDTPLAGQTVEQVKSRGKWLLIHFSGGGTLATHMLMSGSWHIYRPGERWQQPRINMRIVIENSEYIAVGFQRAGGADAHRAVARARPQNSRACDRRAQRRIRRRRSRCAACWRMRDEEIADVLLHQEVHGRRGQRLQVGDLFCHRHQPVLQGRCAQRSSRSQALIAAAQKLVARQRA